MEGLRHPLTQGNKTIGEILAHRRKRYHGVKNPLRGSLLERRIQRAIYCVENDADREFIDWFVADTGMQPQEFLDKWSKKLGI